MVDWEHVLIDYNLGLTERELTNKHNIKEWELNYFLLKNNKRKDCKNKSRLTKYIKQPGQVIHHIDWNHYNNIESNRICLSNQEHKRVHVQLNKIVSLAISKGIIKFDKLKKEYSLRVEE